MMETSLSPVLSTSEKENNRNVLVFLLYNVILYRCRFIEKSVA